MSADSFNFFVIGFVTGLVHHANGPDVVSAVSVIAILIAMSVFYFLGQRGGGS